MVKFWNINNNALVCDEQKSILFNNNLKALLTQKTFELKPISYIEMLRIENQ